MSKTMISVSMGQQIIDARAMPAIDMTELTVQINMNTQLAASVSLVTDVSIETSFRLEQAVNFFIGSADIVQEDSVVIIEALKAQYAIGMFLHLQLH